jgi:hypothetical protein
MTDLPTSDLDDARSDIAKLRNELEDAQYDHARRNEDCIRVREELVPLLREHPLADEFIARDDVRAGYVAKIAADVLRSQATEIERLRLYADTTKHHQDQHAAAVRELEPLKARVAEARNLLDALDRTNDDVHAESLRDRMRNLLDGT